MLKVLVLVVAVAAMVPSSLSAIPKQHAKSCYEIKEYLSATENGLYILYDSNHSPYETYCDFESDVPFIWTLIETFSLEEAQKADNRKTFTIDYGLSQCRLSWSKFRVSKARMDTILSSYGSNYYRATCNFNYENGTGIDNRRDYVRGHLCQNNIFYSSGGYGCRTVEYINVRGQMCRKCPVYFHVASNVHLHIDLQTSATSCSTNIFTDAVVKEDAFGHYDHHNPTFSCAASKASTTNWWIGGAWIAEAV